LAQDDYYYEIQLTNKQLVFYFLAGSAALVLSFLAGVKVGRGVEETASADAGVRRVVEDRIVPEEPAATRPPQAAEDLTYAQRLEGEKLDDTLEKPGAAGPKPLPSPRVAAAQPVATMPAKPLTPAPKPSAAAPKPAPAATPSTAPPPVSVVAKPTPATNGTFAIQVGAFKDRATADSVVTRLKAKGYAAYVVAPDGPEGGLFNVRVGSYPARDEAERAQAKLRDEEKYKPFIVRN